MVCPGLAKPARVNNDHVVGGGGWWLVAGG